MQEIKHTYAFTAALTDMSYITSEAAGIMVGYTLVQPNYTTATTGTLSIIDADGYTVYTGDAKAENTTAVVMGLTVPFGYKYTAKITLDGVAGGAHSVTLKLYIDTRT